jgi:hypothetical protein
MLNGLHSVDTKKAFALALGSAVLAACGGGPSETQFVGTWNVTDVDAVTVTSPSNANNTLTTNPTMTFVEGPANTMSATLGTLPCTFAITLTTDTSAYLSGGSACSIPSGHNNLTDGSGTLNISGGQLSAILDWTYQATANGTTYEGTDQWTLTGSH